MGTKLKSVRVLKKALVLRRIIAEDVGGKGIGRGQAMENDFGFYSTSYRKPLKDFILDQ